MKTRNKKATPGQITGMIIALFLIWLLIFTEDAKSQTPLSKLSTPQKVVVLRGPARVQTTIPDGWYKAEVRRRVSSETKDTVMNLSVKVKSGKVVVIKLDQTHELYAHSRDYEYIGGDISCTYIRGRELASGTAIVSIIKPKKRIVYKILIHG